MRKRETYQKKEAKQQGAVKAPSPVIKIEGNKIQEGLAKAQIEATMALTAIAAQAIDNPQLTQLITMLSQPRQEAASSNKRMIVNRDNNGLIQSIDIKEI